MKEEWLSTEQIAAELGVSRQWVWRRVTDGRIRAVAFAAGRRRTYRIRRSWLNDFLRRDRRDTSVAGWDES